MQNAYVPENSMNLLREINMDLDNLTQELDHIFPSVNLYPFPQNSSVETFNAPIEKIIPILPLPEKITTIPIQRSSPMIEAETQTMKDQCTQTPPKREEDKIEVLEERQNQENEATFRESPKSIVREDIEPQKQIYMPYGPNPFLNDRKPRYDEENVDKAMNILLTDSIH